MVKRSRTVEEIVCDFCGKPADNKCSVCGRDVCTGCTRWICKKVERPVSGGSPISWSGIGGPGSYDPYPWEWTIEKTICKDCSEDFKMSVGVLAGKGNAKH